MKSKTVLVVEDEYASAEMLKFVLELNGFEVRLAANGQDAIATLEQLRPDLILSDVMMPFMDGREFCRQIRSRSEYRDIPIVLMSAVRDVIEAGCETDAFLSKPLDLDLLLETVERLTSDDSAERQETDG